MLVGSPARSPCGQKVSSIVPVPDGLVVSTFSLLSALPTGFNYTRSDSVAMYRDNTGEWQKAATNGALFDHDYSGTPLGLLFEGSRTNKCENTNWDMSSTTGLTKGGNASATLTVGTHPVHGFATYVLDNTQGGSGTATATMDGQFGNTNKHSVRLEYYMETGVGGQIWLSDSGGGFSTNGTAANATDDSLIIEDVTPTAATRVLRLNAALNCKVHFWLNQIEEAEFSTNPIAVDGATATRQLARIEVLDLDNVPAFNVGQGTILVDMTFRGRPGAAQVIAAFSDNGGSDVLGVRCHTDDFIRNYVFGGWVSVAAESANRPIVDRDTIAGVSWNSGAGSVLTIGEAAYYREVTGQTAFPEVPIVQLDIGDDYNGGSPVFGHIRSLTVMNKSRTVDQLGSYIFNSGGKAQVAAGQSLIDNYRRSQGTQQNDGEEGYYTTVNSIRTSGTNYFIQGAWGGSALMQVNEAGGNGFWVATGTSDGPLLTRLKRMLTSAMEGGTTVDCLIWDQGGTDAGNLGAGSVTEAQYKTALEYVFSEVRSHVGNATLPIVIIPIGRRAASSASDGYQNVFNVQFDVVAADANVHMAPGKHDLQLQDETGATDTSHLADASYLVMGRDRVSRKVMKVLGETVSGGVDGPSVSAVSRSGTTVTITVAHDTGTDFTPASGDVEGFEFFDDGVKINWTSKPSRASATTLTGTLASTPTGVETLIYGHGSMDDVSDYADMLVDNATIALPLQRTKALTLPYTA